MKARAICCLSTLCTLVMIGETCQAVTLRFTNAEVNLGTDSQIQLSNQYAPYGLLFNNVYRYIDPRDPFSDAPNQVNGQNLGISNGLNGSIGRVDFNLPTDASGITFDWWNVGSSQLHIEAYNAGGSQIGTFVSPAGIDLSGTNSLPGAIKYFTFHNGSGLVTIANLTFNQVPEPTAALLAMVAVGALLPARWRRR